MENQKLAIAESKFVFSPEVFDPNVDQLEAIKNEVSTITADPKTITKDELITVSDTRKKLMKARTRIKAIGEAEREASNKYSKDVLEYQKKLIGIVEPEEKRLKAIEDEAKQHALRESRQEQLPEMKEKLMSISGEMPKVTDEELLDMDTTQFQQLYNDCREEHFDRLEQEKVEREAKEAEEKAAEEKRIAEEKAEAERKTKEAELAIYNSRVQQVLAIGLVELGEGYSYEDIAMLKIHIKDLSNDEFQKELNNCKRQIGERKAEKAKIEAERVEKEKAKAVEKAKQEAEAKALAEKEAEEKARQDAIEKEKAEQEAKEKAEAEAKAKQEADEKYQNWLSQFNYTPETHHLITENGITTIYKKCENGEYHHNL